MPPRKAKKRGCGQVAPSVREKITGFKKTKKKKRQKLQKKVNKGT